MYAMAQRVPSDHSLWDEGYRNIVFQNRSYSIVIYCMPSFCQSINLSFKDDEKKFWQFAWYKLENNSWYKNIEFIRKRHTSALYLQEEYGTSSESGTLMLSVELVYFPWLYKCWQIVGYTPCTVKLSWIAVEYKAARSSLRAAYRISDSLGYRD